MFEQLGLIGCGLMGGSFALAMKKAGLVKRVVGYSKSPSTTDRARQLGVIDVEAPSALLAVAGADIVLVAVPVAATERTFTAQLQKAQDIWTPLGSRVTSMSPESHDAAFAAVSLLPHVLAFAMMNSITGQDTGDDFLSLAGPGFRDFTRIAASDPKVWRDILLSNRDELIAQSKLFQQALHTIEQAMQKGDAQALEDMLTLASETRAHWRMGAKRK